MTVYTLFLTLSFIYNRVLYALSARDSINRLNALFKKALCWRLAGDNHNVDELLRQCDSRLFNKCFNSSQDILITSLANRLLCEHYMNLYECC